MIGSDKIHYDKFLYPVLDGYIFFEADTLDAEDWKRITDMNRGIVPLQYADGKKELRASDLSFYEWMKRFNYSIEPTLVHKVDTKIVFDSGPLLSGRSNHQSEQKSFRGPDYLCKQKKPFSKLWFPIEYPGTVARKTK